MNKESYIINKLDEIKKDTSDIKVEQAKQGKDIERNTDNLVEHMRRTELAEDAIKANTDKIIELENRSWWTTIKENAKTIVALITIGGAAIAFLEWLLLYLMDKG